MTRRRHLGIACAGAAIAVLACQSVWASAGLQGVESELRAFQRSKVPTDVLRGRFADHLQITDSRRIATYVDRRGRRATLYVAKGRLGLCQVLVQSRPPDVGGAGGGCSPRADFLKGERHIAASSGRLFAGVVANEVARVVIVGSKGVRHPVKVTADGGFIYDCRAYNGCAGLIACVEAYTGSDELLSGQAWLPGGCRSRSAAGANVSCTAAATKALVRTFVGDYNRGRVAAADRVWAPAPRFQWFSTIRPGARLGDHAKDRASLSAYFRARVRAHERLRVTELGAGYDAKRNLVHFGGKLLRAADDLRPTQRDFKGAADCESGRPFLIVWSM